MIIVDGKALAQKMLSKIRTDLNGRSVSIAAVWVGDPAQSISADRHSEKGRALGGASNIAIGRFVEMKKKYAESVGIKMDIYHFENNIKEEEIINKISKLSADGITVELPLPEHLNRDKVLDSIPKEKDIDMLSSSAQEDFYNNRQSFPRVGDFPLRTSKILPPAVGALKILFEEYKVNPKDKVAAVFGQSILVGKPISHWLENQGARVFRIDENTKNTEELCLRADIVVSGVGKPDLITGNMVKNGAVVVDFGFEKLGGKISGDVDFDSVTPKSSLVTPVPGGMGPIVIASFLENALKLCLSQTQ